MKKASIIGVLVLLAAVVTWFLVTGKTGSETPAANRDTQSQLNTEKPGTPPATGRLPVKKAASQRIRAGSVFFDSIEGDEELAKRVTESLHGAMQSMCGMKNILLINDKVPDTRLKYMMSGTAKKSGATLRISMKVKDCLTSGIIYTANEVVSSEGDIDAACRRLLVRIKTALL